MKTQNALPKNNAQASIREDNANLAVANALIDSLEQQEHLRAHVEANTLTSSLFRVCVFASDYSTHCVALASSRALAWTKAAQLEQEGLTFSHVEEVITSCLND